MNSRDYERRGGSRRLRIEMVDLGWEVYGTRDAYVKLATALLQAVKDAPPSSTHTLVLDQDLEDLVADDSDRPEVSLHLVDELPPRDTDPPLNQGKWVGRIIFLLLITLVILAAIGSVAVIRFFR